MTSVIPDTDHKEEEMQRTQHVGVEKSDAYRFNESSEEWCRNMEITDRPIQYVLED